MKPTYIIIIALLATASCKRKDKQAPATGNNNLKYVVTRHDGLLSNVLGCTDGNFIVCGRSLTGTSILVTKLSPIMSVIWTKEFDESVMYLADDIAEAEDGGIVISGNKKDNGKNVVTATKLNADGTLAWQRSFIQSNTYSVPTYITRSADNGYVLGYSFPASTGGDIVLQKISGNGDSSWKRTYSTSGNEYMYAIATTPDHGYIVTGYSGTSSEAKLHLLKADEAGNLLWRKDKSDTAKITRGYKTIVVANGDLVTCGVQHGSNFLGAPGQPFIAKFTASGDDIWFRAYGPDTTDEEFYDLTTNNEGGYAVTGVIRTYINNGGDISMSMISPSLVGVSGEGTELWRRNYRESTSGVSRRILTAPEGYYQFGYDLGINRKFFVRYVNKEGGTQ